MGMARIARSATDRFRCADPGRGKHCMSAHGEVDAHHHVWSLARGDYPWLTPALAAIYRDFSLADMTPLAQGAGIAQSIVVQAAPTIAETRYLLEVARSSRRFVQGVVGWVDLSLDDAVTTLESF